MTATRPLSHLTPRALGASWGALAVIVAVALAALPSVSASPSPAPGAGSSYTPTSWTNGAVLCDFNATLPAVTVSALAVASSGIWLGLSSLTQAGLASVLPETASLSSATWAADNLSGAGSLALVYTTTVNVSTSLGVVGQANVSVTYSLAKIVEPHTNATDRVTVSLTVTDWPWALLGGPLEVGIDVAAAVPSAEHLATPGATGATVSSMSTATGEPVSYITASQSANATSATGILSVVTVVTSLLGLTAAAGTLALSFGAPTNGAKSVGYQAAVVAVVPATSVLPPTGPLGIPTVDYLVAGGAAVLLSLGIAGATRRVRRSPSDLEYIEEEA